MAKVRGATASTSRLSIRAYEPSDRDSIRALVLACADRRAIPECMGSHRDMVADILSRYYTDFEPESCWLAEDASGRTVGFLLGCLSTTRRLWTMVFRIVPAVVVRSLLTGTVCHWPLIRLAKAGLSTWKNGHRVKSQALPMYSAHFHVGVSRECARCGLARELVRRFAAHANAAGVWGIHVSVVEGNLVARGFFESLGFCMLGRYDAVFPGSWSRVGMLLLGRATSPAACPVVKVMRSPDLAVVEE